MTYIVNDSFSAVYPRPSIVARIKATLAIRKQHRVLAALTDEQLTDIGLTRQEVNHYLKNK